MTDINLIQETSGEGKPEERKKKSDSRIEFTQPPSEPKVEEPRPPKKSFFSGFFQRKPKPNRTEPSASQKINQPAPAVQPVPETRSVLQPAFNQKRVTQSSVLEERVEKKKIKPPKPPKVEPVQAEIPPFLDVNLMPGDLIESLEPRKKLITLAIVAGACLLLIALGYFGLVYYEKNIQKGAQDIALEIQGVENKISELRPVQKKALLLKSQTDQIKDVLDRHIYWTNLFDFLERYTLSEVVYEGFTGSFTRGANPTFTLRAQGLDFQSISRQIMAFRDEAKEYVADVSVNSGERTTSDTGEKYVTFGIKLTLFEDLFYKKLEDTKTPGE